VQGTRTMTFLWNKKALPRKYRTGSNVQHSRTALACMRPATPSGGPGFCVGHFSLHAMVRAGLSRPIRMFGSTHGTTCLLSRG